MEREAKGAHLVGDDTDRPNILLFDVWLRILSINYFWGQILNRAHCFSLGRADSLVASLYILCEAEIGEVQADLPVWFCLN